MRRELTQSPMREGERSMRYVIVGSVGVGMRRGRFVSADLEVGRWVRCDKLVEEYVTKCT